MIHLKSIQLENFMNIESLNVDFDPVEVVMIFGDNGSGKSALLAAIALALIGYRKGDSYKDFIRIGCDTAKVYLEVLYKDELLTIDLLINNDKYATPLTRKVTYRKTIYNNSECNELFKTLDTEYLEYVMFLFQRDNSIVDLKPGERAKLLKKLFHFEFEDQIQKLKEELTSYSSSLLETSTRLDIMSKKVFVEEPLEVLNEKNYGTIIKDLEDRIKELELLQLSTAESTEQYIRDLSIKSSKYKQLRLKSTEDILQYTKELQEISILGVPSKSPEQLTTEARAIQETLDRFDGEKQQLLLEKAVLQSKQVELLKRYEHAKEGLCHACGQVIEESILEKSREDLEGCNRKITSIENSILENKAYYEEANVKAVEINNSIQTWLQIEKNTNREKDLKQLIDSLKSNLTQFEAELEIIQDQVQKYEEDEVSRKTLLKRIPELRQLKEQLAAARAADRNQQIVKALNEERLRRNNQIKQEKLAHDELLISLSQEVNKLALQIENTKKAIHIFEIEFPNFIILQTCSHLEEYINSVIQRVFSYMKVKLLQSRSGVEFFYSVNEGNQWLSVKMASGAQAAILSLAWRVAIAKLYGITTLLLDEVDAESTDENSKQIYEFLSSLDMFDQLLVISHRKDALRTVASQADNVTCYHVNSGEYSKISDLEFLE